MNWRKRRTYRYTQAVDRQRPINRQIDIRTHGGTDTQTDEAMGGETDRRKGICTNRQTAT